MSPYLPTTDNVPYRALRSNIDSARVSVPACVVAVCTVCDSSDCLTWSSIIRSVHCVIFTSNCATQYFAHQNSYRPWYCVLHVPSQRYGLDDQKFESRQRQEIFLSPNLPDWFSGTDPFSYFIISQVCKCNITAVATAFVYRGADNSLARPGRKQATATKL